MTQYRKTAYLNIWQDFEWNEIYKAILSAVMTLIISLFNLDLTRINATYWSFTNDIAMNKTVFWSVGCLSVV